MTSLAVIFGHGMARCLTRFAGAITRPLERTLTA